MEYTIKNSVLSVVISDLGAQLLSVRAHGTEYLWQGDARFWSGRAPILFPYVGRLTGGVYTHLGQTYAMGIHGFLRHCTLAAVQRKEASVTFTLRESEETLAQYPFPFVFTAQFTLAGATLMQRWAVQNTGAALMAFGLGAHPGINVPLEPGLAFEDYALRFDAATGPALLGLSPDCFMNGGQAPYPLENGATLRLAHTLFDNDALVFSGLGDRATLFAAGGARGVTLTFPGMPFFGLWHMPQTTAPYVCLEPWVSLPARAGRTEELLTQPHLVHLAPGETYTNTWTLAVH